MSKRVRFYATSRDILSVLALVEDKCRVQYIRTGNNDHPRVSRYLRGAEIPEIGIADQGTGSVCRAFLVMLAETTLNVDTFRGSDGHTRYSISQLLNEDSVVFRPAGMWRSSILLCGEVATLSGSDHALLLMKHFRAAIRKLFKCYGIQWIGPEAMALWASGSRLTIADQSPPEYNLDYHRMVVSEENT